MMKKLLFLLLFPATVFAQFAGENNYEQFLRAQKDTGATTTYQQIFSRSYAGGITDTVEALNVSQYKTTLLTLATTDSATFLIDYRLSVDNVNWSAFATKDSLTQAAAGNGVKSVDFTSTVLGAKHIQFRLRTSALAFALGTTTPKYWAYILLRKY